MLAADDFPDSVRVTRGEFKESRLDLAIGKLLPGLTRFGEFLVVGFPLDEHLRRHAERFSNIGITQPTLIHYFSDAGKARVIGDDLGVIVAVILLGGSLARAAELALSVFRRESRIGNPCLENPHILRGPLIGNAYVEIDLKSTSIIKCDRPSALVRNHFC